ncbi:hypothetical protein KJ909_03970 [Patescibacteria group bacterium]|nr:hypothetical protein [Patescibacteria group bacterium]
MKNFTVTRWHPFSTAPDLSKDTDEFDVAFTEAGTMRSLDERVNDERVTIFFNHTGRWVEWIWDQGTGGWRFYEM